MAVGQNLTYRREFRPGDIVEVGSRVEDLRKKSLRSIRDIANIEIGVVAATCGLTDVHMDRATRRVVPDPTRVRAAFSPRCNVRGLAPRLEDRTVHERVRMS